MNASSPVTINKWLQTAQAKLKKAGIPTYPLDSLVLLETVTSLNKAHILAHQDNILTPQQLTTLQNYLERRAQREPLAYITGIKEFYGRNFFVDTSVLIPRPESESFVEILKNTGVTHKSLADVGSGSGCIGITIKLEIPTMDVTLIDIDQNALKVSAKNAKQHNAQCRIVQSDLLPTHHEFTVIVANLPYVPKDLSVAPELSFEPPVALYAENDGLALYEHLWQQIPLSRSCTHVLTESLKSQHQTMESLAFEAGFSLRETDGLVQLFTKIN